MAASVEMMYSVAGSLPPQVTQDPRGFSLNCIVPDALVAGLLGPGGSATMEVQMITSAQIEIKSEASNGPAHKTMKITGGLINVCSAYILMMKRYLDVERGAGLAAPAGVAAQIPQSVATGHSPTQANNDALSKALSWMTELQSSSTGPAVTPEFGTTPATDSAMPTAPLGLGTMPGMNAALTGPAATVGLGTMPSMNAALAGPAATGGLGTMPGMGTSWAGTLEAFGTMPAMSTTLAGPDGSTGLQPNAFNPLPGLQNQLPGGQLGGQLPGLQNQLPPPLQQPWQHLQPPQPQLQQLPQLPAGQGAGGTAQAVALSQHATTILQQQGLASNDAKVKEMTQLQEHLNALQAQVAAQNMRQ